MKTKQKLIRKVRSLRELGTLAKTDVKYRQLAIAAAQNLGGNVDVMPEAKKLDHAMRWLRVNAQETDEAGVVEEINYVRDLV